MRQLLADLRQMMVCHDQVKPESSRGFRSRESANAGINAYYQLDAGNGSVLQNVIPHPVSLADTMRHMEFGNSAQQFDARLKDNDRSRAVHVVIAIDEQRLFVGD